MERNTSQKQIILDYLQKVTTHPSADEVFQAVREKLPNISKGTVYRILNNFRKKGMVQAVQSKTSHYDGDTSSHSHFICNNCGNIYDLFDFPKECKYDKNTKIGKITNHQIYFYGTCKKCSTKK